jgi:hypothetical protein
LFILSSILIFIFFVSIWPRVLSAWYTWTRSPHCKDANAAITLLQMTKCAAYPKRVVLVNTNVSCRN